MVKQCPECQFLVPPETETCNFCGHDFELARAEAEIAATRLLAEEAAARLREQAQAKGTGHFSTTRVARPGEEHLEAPVSRTVIAALALLGLLLLVGVGWWVTRPSDTTTTRSGSTPTVGVYVPPTTTLVAYSSLTTQPAPTVPVPVCTKKCPKVTTTSTPINPNLIRLGPIQLVMPGAITVAPPAGSVLSEVPLVAESTVSAGHFARVRIQSVDVTVPGAAAAVIDSYAASASTRATRATDTTAFGGLPAVDFDLGTNQEHHGLAIVGPGFVLILDVWRTTGVGNSDDASAFALLNNSLAAAT